MKTMMMRVAVKQMMEGYSKTAKAAGVMAMDDRKRHFSRFSQFSSEEQEEGNPNPPDPENPDPSTLREQWRYAISLYSKWYSHAWGTAILAGLSFFAIGWLVKGGNPLTSRTPVPSADDKPEAP